MSSYWLSEPSSPLPKTRVDDPEVVVVGGGVTGCAAALRLAQAGKRVRLYDGRAMPDQAAKAICSCSTSPPSRSVTPAPAS